MMTGFPFAMARLMPGFCHCARVTTEDGQHFNLFTKPMQLTIRVIQVILEDGWWTSRIDTIVPGVMLQAGLGVSWDELGSNWMTIRDVLELLVESLQIVLLQSRGEVLQIVSVTIQRVGHMGYPCATDCRTSDVVLGEDISVGRAFELVENSLVIANVIVHGVIGQSRTLVIPVIQVRFLISKSMRSRTGRFLKEY
jgi:hypothetical protein